MPTQTHNAASYAARFRRPSALALAGEARSVGAPMRSPFARAALLAFPLLLAACRDPEVVSYKIPKETDPDPTATAAHAHAAAGVNPGAAANPSAPAAPAGAPAAAPAAGSSADKNMANTAVATASGAGLAWTAPANWQAKPGSAMRKGSYAITGEGGTADMAITAFPGDVGGEVANVNRWRGQIQLPPVSESEVAKAITRLEANGLKIAWVELANNVSGAPTRVLGAWVPFQNSTWFFKLSGPDALVAKEKAAFLQFLTTVKSANP